MIKENVEIRPPLSIWDRTTDAKFWLDGRKGGGELARVCPQRADFRGARRETSFITLATEENVDRRLFAGTEGVKCVCLCGGRGGYKGLTLSGVEVSSPVGGREGQGC